MGKILAAAPAAIPIDSNDKPYLASILEEIDKAIITAAYNKVCSEIKETTLSVGYFTTISGHSFANYINILHKTEVQTVILRCLISLNLNWIKSYNINYNCVFQFWKKKN